MNIRTHVGAGFSLCPHYTISFGFCLKLSRLTADLWTVPFQIDFADLIKTIKSRLNALAVALCLFFDRLIFARSPTDAKPLQTHCLAGVARRGVRRAALACGVYGFGPSSCRSLLHALARCHARLHVSSPLVSAVSLSFVSRPRSLWSPLAANSRLSRSLALNPQTRQKLLLAPPTPYCVIASIRPQC